jgi:hypothetical protein
LGEPGTGGKPFCIDPRAPRQELIGFCFFLSAEIRVVEEAHAAERVEREGKKGSKKKTPAFIYHEGGPLYLSCWSSSPIAFSSYPSSSFSFPHCLDWWVELNWPKVSSLGT